MENKEQLEQLIDHIKSLTKLTDEIADREIYPVSFFSQAYDITNRMQELLHQMEVFEIALFERHMKEHQAQIRSVGRFSDPAPTAVEPVSPPVQQVIPAPPPPPFKPEPPKVVPPPPPPVAPVVETPTVKTPVVAPPLRYETPPPPPVRPVQEKAEVFLNETIEKNLMSDLKKAFTLNDRFRFCRDLFSRDENLMNRTLAELNVKGSYEASVSYLKEQFDWDFEDETVAGFVAILEKRFS
jgi:hypothetical protein